MSKAVDGKTENNEDEVVPVLELNAVSRKGTIPCRVSGSLRIPFEDTANLELFLPVGVAGPPVNIMKYAKIPKEPTWRVLVDLSNDHLPKPAVVKGKVCQKYVCVNALLSFDCSPAYTINDDLVKHNEKLREEIRKVLEANEDNQKDEIQRYLRLNYIRSNCLLSEDINPGEWLLPVKVKEVSGTEPASTKTEEVSGTEPASTKTEEVSGTEPASTKTKEVSGTEPASGTVLAYVKVKIEDQPDTPADGETPDQSKSASNT